MGNENSPREIRIVTSSPRSLGQEVLQTLSLVSLLGLEKNFGRPLGREDELVLLDGQIGVSNGIEKCRSGSGYVLRLDMSRNPRTHAQELDRLVRAHNGSVEAARARMLAETKRGDPGDRYRGVSFGTSPT